jgi:RimJ/RimL family protein N-acetyltransferase
MFNSQSLRLTPVDLEKDPQVVAGWTENLSIAGRLRIEPPLRPLATFEVRKLFEAWNKELEDSNRAYFFALRSTSDDRLVGYLRINEIMWLHGAALFDMVIGQQADWEYLAHEALTLGLQFAFDELNLFRVAARVAEHDQLSCTLYQNAQFSLEVRQRQGVFYQGRYWDKLQFGLLRPEWAVFHQHVEVVQ